MAIIFGSGDLDIHDGVGTLIVLESITLVDALLRIENIKYENLFAVRLRPKN
jgi:hypothetical protein